MNSEKQRSDNNTKIMRHIETNVEWASRQPFTVRKHPIIDLDKNELSRCEVIESSNGYSYKVPRELLLECKGIKFGAVDLVNLKPIKNE